MFYTKEELLKIGFKSIGDNVLISNKASIYGAKNIEIGSNTRIDDFCIISAGEGGIKIGNYVHISCGVSLIGQGKITVEDFANISGKCSVYSSSDDYSGAVLIGPLVPAEFTEVDHRPVYIGKYAIIGCNSVVLPGSVIPEGCGFGALSLVNGEYESYKLYGGIPAKYIKDRKRVEEHLDLDQILKYN
jgi:dTDP-4-amino-4,6-dideoxy-D-glucose acyltransferase